MPISRKLMRSSFSPLSRFVSLEKRCVSWRTRKPFFTPTKKLLFDRATIVVQLVMRSIRTIKKQESTFCLLGGGSCRSLVRCSSGKRSGDWNDRVSNDLFSVWNICGLCRIPVRNSRKRTPSIVDSVRRVNLPGGRRSAILPSVFLHPIAVRRFTRTRK